MAIAFRAAGVAGNSLGPNAVVAMPAGVQPDDLVIVAFVVDMESSSPPTAPDGWGTVVPTFPITDYIGNIIPLELILFFRIGPQAPTYTFVNGEACAWRAFAYSGVDIDLPFDVRGVRAFVNKTGSPATISFNGITTLTDNAWLVGVSGFGCPSTSTPTWGNFFSGAATDRGSSTLNEGVSLPFLSLDVCDVAQAVKGASGAKNIDIVGLVGADIAYTMTALIALRPAIAPAAQSWGNTNDAFPVGMTPEFSAPDPGYTT